MAQARPTTMPATLAAGRPIHRPAATAT
jgi:hypothetical protein